ncbi:unnamed protein product, partial [Musa acuminata var. zebrina]
ELWSAFSATSLCSPTTLKVGQLSGSLDEHELDSKKSYIRSLSGGSCTLIL